MRTKLKKIYKTFKKKYAKHVYKTHAPYLEHYDRIYHVHIRKSAGTSINAAFWGLSGLRFKSVRRKALLVKGKYVYVRNNEHLIEDGRFFYANSHIPFWNLSLPSKTFTFCMIRDPYKRLVSLYRYLKWVKDLDPKTAISAEPYYRTVLKQTVWLGHNFSEFLDNLPQKHLQNQLLMFSESGDVDEALKSINSLNAIYNQEHFEKAIEDLSKVVGTNLQVKKERVFGRKKELMITEEEEQKARRLLADEYEFYNRIEQKFAVL